MRLGFALVRRVAVAAWLTACSLASPAVAGTVMVPVRLPLTGTRDTQVEAAVLRSLGQLRDAAPERGTLVLRFDAVDGEAAGGSDFGRAIELARFLADDRLAGVKTVAWLPKGATGHAVLVALACDEIAMPAEAVLGPATGASDRPDEAVQTAYRLTAARRRTIPPAVAEAFADPAARVVRASTDDGEQFVGEDELDDLRKRAAVINVEPLQPSPLAFDGRRGRELGFVRILARSPAELARGIGVAERDLAADPALDGGWRPAIVSTAAC
jgi:hypothetical protein